MRHSNGAEVLKIARCYRRYRFRALLYNRTFLRRVDEMKRRNGAATIQRQWRAHVERRMVFELRKKLNAARSIQRIARGTMARKFARRAHRQAKAASASRRAALMNLKLENTTRSSGAHAASGAGGGSEVPELLPGEAPWKQPHVGRNNFIEWMLRTRAIGAALAL